MYNCSAYLVGGKEVVGAVKEYINSLDNVEAIWYTNDNKIELSDDAKKYVYK